jgi:hypothetical protein
MKDWMYTGIFVTVSQIRGQECGFLFGARRLLFTLRVGLFNFYASYHYGV